MHSLIEDGVEFFLIQNVELMPWQSSDLLGGQRDKIA